jgi:hypothetical protein
MRPGVEVDVDLAADSYNIRGIASGFSETNRVKEAQRLGAGRFVRKPPTLSGLGRAIWRELDGI